ncbi:disintegrin and metallo ase domain-containing 10-like [Paramuricea clavata]|uniref:Disintegrin and metallo ase domain-containing 10-like n=1 Tax=Paramuricea clavata TaxID=317549 RepID=A0A7D9HQK1_PARCT|nr:disintegrin and metallo ase domain-containing 10-like [Paramuricea clavata]
MDGKLTDQLVDFVSYYETTKLDIRVLDNNGSHKRSNAAGFLLNLSAFDRNFSAILWPDNKVFQSKVQVKIISKYKEHTKWLSENLIYEGQLTDKAESRVSGYFTRGQFHGQISVQQEDTFYIEAFRNRLNQSHDTIIIYREKDIIENYTSCSHTYSVPQIRDHVTKHRRSKRLSTYYNSCPVLVAADSNFYKHVGKSSTSTTLAKMAYYISEADKIFRSTKFYEGQDESIGVIIASLVVYEDLKSEGIFSSPSDIPVDKYLKSWSKLNHDSYCLSLLLTYRDFSKGVLGLAWLAELNTLGGICEPWNTHYSMSFNTAVVTFLNHGKMIGDRTATLTVAHELGHGFGAQHDQEECQPGGRDGNYIMYEHSSDAAHPNNDKFSQCSVNDMRKMLQARAHECFTDGSSYCGNEIIETGEQCDCGDRTGCHIRDPCCVAKDDWLLNIRRCRLKSTAQCSPKAGACCTSECKFINDTERKVCQEETECSFTSYCENGTCPGTQRKPDNKICNNGSNVCKNGECKGSICSYYGLNQCPCDEMGYLCQVCCNNTMDECVPSSQFTGSILTLPDKTPCGENKFCDDIGQCEEHTDQYYENEDSFDVIIYWLKNKWYIFLFIAIATAAKIVFISYRHCRVHRARRHEAQSEGLETIHTEYPSRLQMESYQQTHSETTQL